MYFNNAEWLLSLIYPSLIWSVKENEKNIYLTFDDGPIPEITDYVIKELEAYAAKATFFVVGDNVRKHPEQFCRIIKAGHSVGNHTFNHLNGWKTNNEEYLQNIFLCEQVIEDTLKKNNLKLPPRSKKIFRPPYGKINKSVISSIRSEYDIVMWKVLTGDFDKNLKSEKCLHKSIKYTDSGSVVVFHDSIKAENNLRYVLPRFLNHFASKGYSFKAL